MLLLSENSIEIRYEDENIWLTQKMMATLYDVGTNTINYHIKKIFDDSELQEDSVIRKFRITAADGKGYSTNHYSLEMIIAVGFKENLPHFYKWGVTIQETVQKAIDEVRKFLVVRCLWQGKKE